jgi:hypothetical protein
MILVGEEKRQEGKKDEVRRRAKRGKRGKIGKRGKGAKRGNIGKRGNSGNIGNRGKRGNKRNERQERLTAAERMRHERRRWGRTVGQSKHESGTEDQRPRRTRGVARQKPDLFFKDPSRYVIRCSNVFCRVLCNVYISCTICYTFAFLMLLTLRSSVQPLYSITGSALC